MGSLEVFSCIYLDTFQTKITATSSFEKIGTFKRAGLQWLSSNKHTLQIFWNQAEIASYNEWLQQVLWIKHSFLDILIASSAPVK